MNLADIENVIKGMRLTSRWKELSLNVFFLIQDLRSTFLWDLGQITKDQLLKLSSLIDDLIILDIAGDLIICSRHGLIKHLRNIILNTPVVIDVSGSLSDPALLTSTEAEIQIQALGNILHSVEIDQQAVQTIDANSTCNLCTLFGLMLGFPVVYYFDVEMDTNCLSNQNLIVYKVGVNNLYPISFSIPRILEPECKNVLDSWLQDMRVKISCINSSINISHVHVNLPAVSL